MNSASSGSIALGTLVSELTDQLLQRFDIPVIQDRRYQFALLAVRTFNADIPLELPLSALSIPC
jgi:hypothetical protein